MLCDKAWLVFHIKLGEPLLYGLLSQNQKWSMVQNIIVCHSIRTPLNCNQGSWPKKQPQTKRTQMHVGWGVHLLLAI